MPATGTMAPTPMEPLGFLQLRVMHHIWRTGPSTVHDVHVALNAQPDAPKQLAYTPPCSPSCAASSNEPSSTRNQKAAHTGSRR